MEALAEKIYQQAMQCGFDQCGIIPVSALTGFLDLYQKRLNDVPMSQYFYGQEGMLAKTQERFPWTKAIVILVFDYGKYRFPSELQGKYGKAFFLEPEKETEERFDLESFETWFSENGIHAEGGEHFGAFSIGPLRYMAMQAGLGIIRKNNFFYTDKGSYVNLYAYAIDKECELIHENTIVPCSEKCDLCRRACKTGSLQAPYTMNPFKCVSFLTTFGNCEVPDGLSDEMYGEWIIGCDNCQDVCPHNKRHNWSRRKALASLENIASEILPENYDNLTDEFLIKYIIPKTSNHLQEKDVLALRKNAMRSLVNKNDNGRNAIIY